jgi:toxin ParE1/3/4
MAASARYLAGFERLFQLLREQPFAGQERPEFARGIRSLSHRPCRILYRVRDDTVVIVRVLHHAQDAPRTLLGNQ